MGEKSNSSLSATTTKEIKQDLWLISDHIVAVWTIFHMLQKLVLESNLPVRVSIRYFRRKLGPSGFFALQSAIFFIAVLFLMVSINICRVISTFITQGAFSIWCCLLCSGGCFWTESFLCVDTLIQRATMHTCDSVDGQQWDDVTTLLSGLIDRNLFW